MPQNRNNRIKNDVIDYMVGVAIKEKTTLETVWTFAMDSYECTSLEVLLSWSGFSRRWRCCGWTPRAVPAHMVEVFFEV